MTPKLQALVDEMKAEVPQFKLVEKQDSRLMRFLSKLMFFNPQFMDHYCTTIGYTVYMPKAWNDHTRWEVLRHERVHIRDYKRWGALFSLSYIFLLPAVFTMRAYWEFRGYEETLKASWEERGRPMNADGKPWLAPDLGWVVGNFTGPGYFFMFPFPGLLRKWFQRAADRWNQ